MMSASIPWNSEKLEFDKMASIRICESMRVLINQVYSGKTIYTASKTS